MSLVKVVAHRGASFAHPPGNTIPAFADAESLGADWVELDVHATADGVVVVHHDPTLSDGRWLGDLAFADLPDWVPSLDVVLDICHPLGVNVEIKTDNRPETLTPLIENTVALLELRQKNSGKDAGNNSSDDEFLISSFDFATLAQCRKLAPQIPTGFLVLQFDKETISAASEAGHSAINPWDALVNQELVAMAHDNGLAVNVWTVDDPTRIKELQQFGVDSIITNKPDLCREVLDA